MPGMYKSVGDGFRQIKAADGLRGFTLVSIKFLFLLDIREYNMLILTRFVFRDGPQLWLDTQLKVLENSDSTKSSRMYTEVLLAQKKLPSIKLSDLLSHLHALKSLPIAYYAQWKQ